MDDDESPITTLVAAAADGDARAWNEIVSRYSPLLVAVIRRFRLSNAEVEDVAQTVWLRTVEQLANLREPRALPQWIIVTARREALRQVTSARRAQPRDPLDPVWLTNVASTEDPDERLIYAERHEALLAGLAELPERQRELILLLTASPPLTYEEIHRRTGIPIGSIGPTRKRALERLRRTAPIAAHRDAAAAGAPSGGERRDDATLG
jgi:RNA polymerase sigma factor (sigma-70 family)